MPLSELALTGGDDYELCFSVPRSEAAQLQHNLLPERSGYHCLGELRAASGTEVMSKGAVIEFSHSRYDHFAS